MTSTAKKTNTGNKTGTGKKRDDERRGYGFAPLARTLPRITRRLVGKRGGAEAELQINWASIVGPEIAAETSPEKLSFPKRGERLNGVLQVRVTSTAAVDLLHLEPMVVERLNGYFGYPAIDRLRLRQAPPRQTQSRQAQPTGRQYPDSPPPARRPPDPAAMARAIELAAQIPDPVLRESMLKLARTALSRRDS